MNAKTLLAVAGLWLGLIGMALGQPSDTEKKVRELAAELKSGETIARRRATENLADIGPKAKPAEPELLAALKDKDLFVRRGAVRALGLIGADPEKAAPALARMLKDENKEVAEAAGNALSKLGEPGLKPLMTALKDKDPLVKRVAVRSLGEFGKEAKPALSLLIEGLKEEPAMRRPMRGGENLRGEIVITLGKMGPAAKDAVPAIKATLENNRDRQYRQAAEVAIRKIEGRG